MRSAPYAEAIRPSPLTMSVLALRPAAEEACSCESFRFSDVQVADLVLQGAGERPDLPSDIR